MKHTPIFTLLICLLLSASAASAAAITNLDDAQRTIALIHGGSDETIVIAPGETFRRAGQIHVKYRDRELHIEDNEEYAIWKGGDLGPQRHLNDHNKGF